MRKRLIVYDLHHKDVNSYKDLYKLLDEFKSEMLNESAYIINSDLNQDQIIKKIRDAIEKDDNFYFVSVDVNNKLFCKKI